MIEIAGLTIGALGFAYFLWDRYRPAALKVDFDSQNVAIPRFYSLGSQVNLNLALVFNGISITNTGNRPESIKTFEVEYQANGYRQVANTHSMLPTKIWLRRELESDCVVVTYPARGNIILMSWKDFATVNNNTSVLNPGETIRFMAVFVLQAKEISALRRKGWRFVIQTFSGKRSVQGFELADLLLSEWEEAFLRRELFAVDEEGKIAVHPMGTPSPVRA